MNKHLIILGIAILLLVVDLSGCQESKINDDEEFNQWMLDNNEFFHNTINHITDTADNYLSGIYSTDEYYTFLAVWGHAQKVVAEGCINEIENFTLSEKWNVISVSYLEFLIDTYWAGYYYEIGGENKNDDDINLASDYTRKAGEHMMEVSELLD